MIARVAGYGGQLEYVPLRLSRRTRRRDVWVAVRDDRGRRGEMYMISAIGHCAKDLQIEMGPALETAKKLFRLTQRGEDLTTKRRAELHELARELSDMIERAEVQLKRLLDVPTRRDQVEIDAEIDYSRGLLPD